MGSCVCVCMYVCVCVCVCVCVQSLQLFLMLWDPMDCSLLVSSVHGILQARTLEWVSMPPPWDFLLPGILSVSPVSPTLQVSSLPMSQLGSPDGFILHGNYESSLMDFTKHDTFERLPCGSVVKNSPANAGDTGLIPGPRRFHMHCIGHSLQQEKPLQWEAPTLQL